MRFLCSHNSSFLLNTFCLSYHTTRVLLETLIPFQIVKKFPRFYENRNTFSLDTGNLHLSGPRHTYVTLRQLTYRVILSLEAQNYCLCMQSNSAGFSFINTGKQVQLKHARRHFERNLVKDVHHRSDASRNWLKS